MKNLRAEFQIGSLGRVEKLEYGKIPSLVSRCLNGIAADVTEGTERWVGKCASVEPCRRRMNSVRSESALRDQDFGLWLRVALHNAPNVRVSNLIRSLRDPAGPAIGVGEIAVRVEHGVPVAA